MSRYLRGFVVSALVLVLMLAGCASFKMRGSFVPDRDVARSFSSYELRGDMNYYASGSDAYPSALMGLKKEYTLESGLWKKVDKAETFKDMVQGMKRKTGAMVMPLHGFQILDNEGRPIGTWYSILSARMLLVMKEDKHVLVYTPDIDTYLRYDREDSEN